MGINWDSKRNSPRIKNVLQPFSVTLQLLTHDFSQAVSFRDRPGKATSRSTRLAFDPFLGNFYEERKDR
jgi:hypothetical protein